MSEPPPTLPWETTLADLTGLLAYRLAATVAEQDVLGSIAVRAAGDLDRARSAGADGSMAAERARRSTAAGRLARLRREFALTAFELDLLALAALPAEHEGLASLLAELHPRREPSAWIGLAAELLLEDAGERPQLMASLMAGPLADAFIVRMDRHPFPYRSLQLPPGLWEALHGYDAWPDGIQAPLPDTTADSGLDGWLATEPLELAVRMLAAPDTTVLLTTDDPADGLLRAGALVRAAGRQPRQLGGGPAELDSTDAAAVALLCTVRDEVPVLCATEADAGFLAGQPGLKLPLILVAAPGQDIDPGRRTLIRVAAAPASVSSRLQMWDALLPGDSATAHQLAAVHRAGPLQASRALADATAVAATLRQPRLDQTLVARALRQRALVTLPAAARLVEPSAAWSDLVLSEEQSAVLLSAAARARNQAMVLQDWAMGLGRPGTAGVRLLFAGPPGTGKTMAAELLAAELGLDLLVVDLAAMVSRWLGETEKNLAAVFDAAERCQAVLFFDEAESLFARRTAVSDSHDRWANLETAYLLGRMERFDGVTVLATNLRANIDEAFIRRLEYIIDFTDPTSPERQRLWQGHLPATVPLDAGVRLDELAELYPLTGGIIRNAAMAAAFLAAADGGRITQQHLVTAVRREYEKSGRSFPGIPRRLNGRG